ncbi:MAG TPA: hypothetical protein VF549_18115 [Solirubrobacteraceae bacterium]
MTNNGLALIIATLGTVLSARSLGTEAVAITAVFLLGLFVSEVGRRAP